MVHCCLRVMSLKAKIEAVIYASEEPVTLGQLMSLLGEEAQAELEAAQERQGRLALEASTPTSLVMEAEAAPEAGKVETLEALTTATMGTKAIVAQESPGDEGAQPSSEAESPAGFDSEKAAPDAADLKVRERRLRDYMRSVLDRLLAEYRSDDRGLEIREIAGGYRFATKPEYHDAVRGFVRSLKPPLRLSLQALETLAVVAYKQPATAPEVSEVRGVDSSGVLGSLLGRKLVATAGRKQVIGRPILYKTTKEFLLRFGLKDLSELPSIEEFERLASDMNVAMQEEMPMPLDTSRNTVLDSPKDARPHTVVPVSAAVDRAPLSQAEVARDVDPSRNTHLSQADGDPNPSTLSPDEVSAEHLTPGPDGPSEFTGNESVPPVDNITADGRISGLPPVYDTPTDEVTDSPANDAAVRNAEAEPQGS